MSGPERTIAITGASGLIGRALAVHFAGPGVRLVLGGRDRERLEAVRVLCADRGAAAEAHRLDLRKPVDIEAFAHAADAPDVLINNAADVTSKPFLETTAEEIASLIETNVTGPLQLCRLLAPGMVERGGGAIVNCSSLAGYKCNPAQTVYSISKGAVNSLSEALRAELGPRGMTVVHLALSSVTEDGAGGTLRAADVAGRVERAIERGEAEVFFSPATRLLMRLYGAAPWLKRLR